MIGCINVVRKILSVQSVTYAVFVFQGDPINDIKSRQWNANSLNKMHDKKISFLMLNPAFLFFFSFSGGKLILISYHLVSL